MVGFQAIMCLFIQNRMVSLVSLISIERTTTIFNLYWSFLNNYELEEYHEIENTMQ